MTLRRVTGRVSVTREDDLDDHGAFVLDYGRQVGASGGSLSLGSARAKAPARGR